MTTISWVNFLSVWITLNKLGHVTSNEAKTAPVFILRFIPYSRAHYELQPEQAIGENGNFF